MFPHVVGPARITRVCFAASPPPASLEVAARHLVTTKPGVHVLHSMSTCHNLLCRYTSL